MKALRLNEPGKWELLEKKKPLVLKETEVLCQVKKIGVCGTDLHAFKGQQPFFSYPRILGHELAVEVVEVGEKVSNVSVGDRCAVMPYYNEGTNQAIKNGKPNCGNNLRVLGVHVDGGMQEYIVYESEFLFKSNQLTLEQLALIEPLAIGRHAVERSKLSDKDIVLVIGAGPIGLGTTIFAKLNNARVILMDLDDKKLEMAKEITGIKEVINATDEIEKQLLTILKGDAPTVILDATGNSKSMMKTFDYVAAGGSIVFIGLFMGQVFFDDPTFHKKELTLMASRAALASDFEVIIKLIEKNEFDPSSLISHRLSFGQLDLEFEKLFDEKNDLIKAMIDVE